MNNLVCGLLLVLLVITYFVWFIDCVTPILSPLFRFLPKSKKVKQREAKTAKDMEEVFEQLEKIVQESNDT